MSKRYNIRWTESDLKELNKAVKNFNAKIDYHAKKDPKNKSALPEKMSVRQLKNLIDTRQDLNREINSLRRFSQKGKEEFVTVPDNDYNLKITKWQKEEMTRRAGVINRRRKERLQQIQDIEVKQGGKSLGYTRGQVGMGKADEVALSPVNAFTPKMNRTDLKYKHKQLIKESRDRYYKEKEERLKENYIQALKNNYNSDDPIVAEVIEEIEDMDFEDFYATFQEEDPNFEFAYAPVGADRKAYAEQLKSTWKPNKK